MNTTTTDPAGDFAAMVKAELARARAVHPKPINSLHEGSAVLREEFDEFWQEVLKREKRRDFQALTEELVQVAAVAQRIFEDVVEAGKVAR